MKCRPTWYCQSIYELDLDFLKNENVKCILTDLDNTLAPYNIPNPDQKVIELVKRIKDAGFNLIIVSNNTGKRVQLFASGLGLDYISGAKKPFTSTIKKGLNERNIMIEDCVLIGDQIMTDIKCANKMNCKCILTSPLTEKESFVTFFNRRLDLYYRKKYNFCKTCKRIDRSGR